MSNTDFISQSRQIIAQQERERDQHIQLALLAVLSRRGKTLDQICARTWVNSLDAIRVLCDMEQQGMVKANRPDIIINGDITNEIMRYCQKATWIKANQRVTTDTQLSTDGKHD